MNFCKKNHHNRFMDSKKCFLHCSLAFRWARVSTLLRRITDDNSKCANHRHTVLYHCHKFPRFFLALQYDCNAPISTLDGDKQSAIIPSADKDSKKMTTSAMPHNKLAHKHNFLLCVRKRKIDGME